MFTSSALRPEFKWLLLASGSAILAGFAARSLVKTVWRTARHDDPPMNPAALDTGWPEAVTWAVASGLAAGVARLVARRGAAASWQRVTGSHPPAINKSLFSE